ncbi:hypothetical protein I79_010414 [Cricetulus griseus]|uniref:Uncharacterized protein n=1 Tax=Cricetulus griseus TaxID=10029 RepID=G3HIF3_CRIGR|nr:hypothetical protein I79_010414 [Cricetulus griseus]
MECQESESQTLAETGKRPELQKCKPETLSPSGSMVGRSSAMFGELKFCFNEGSHVA